ncbi:MAG: hypothetical protein JWM84_1559 [Nocardioides sp.]|nr:hypothetical protein [Nocardioides sp.]
MGVPASKHFRTPATSARACWQRLTPSAATDVLATTSWAVPRSSPRRPPGRGATTPTGSAPSSRCRRATASLPRGSSRPWAGTPEACRSPRSASRLATVRCGERSAPDGGRRRCAGSATDRRRASGRPWPSRIDPEPRLYTPPFNPSSSPASAPAGELDKLLAPVDTVKKLIAAGLIDAAALGLSTNESQPGPASRDGLVPGTPIKVRDLVAKARLGLKASTHRTYGSYMRLAGRRVRGPDSVGCAVRDHDGRGACHNAVGAWRYVFEVAVKRAGGRSATGGQDRESDSGHE